MSLAFLDLRALQSTLLLAAVAGTAVAATTLPGASRPTVAVCEGAIASLVVGVALPDGLLLLPYLVVPSMLVGIDRGARAVLAVVAGEAFALGLVAVLSGVDGSFSVLASVLIPWLLTALGIGLLTAWMRERRGGLWSGDESYEQARRLLTQLRGVAGRLSSGLDTVNIGHEILGAVHEQLHDSQSALFARTEGGLATPLTFRGSQAQARIHPDGMLTDSWWQEGAPIIHVQASGSSDRRYLAVVPLKVGPRLVAAVLAEMPNRVDEEVLASLSESLAGPALQLDAGLAFDEFKSLVTIEERRRLAREIHDGVAQEIASLGYAVDDLAADATSERQQRRLHELRRELRRIVNELRLSIFDLRNEASSGLGSALSDYVRQVGARSGLTVHLTLDEAPTRLRPDVETELLRIAQEAITNARKHAAARNLWVNCHVRPPHASITIRDDGHGLGSGRLDSYGISIMRERAAKVNAVLNIETLTGSGAGPSTTGTAVTIQVDGGKVTTAAMEVSDEA